MSVEPREDRNECVASLYLGVNVTTTQVDGALEKAEQLLFAQAFEAAAEAAKRVLRDAGRDYRVEVDA